ncbi:hypothetical protein OsI_09580 [Oryza sativa Indica Group]|uniref:RRM domain-containing protein n=1 Tax=Oryza sativa subsp. indica TaxID=39946 RepID=A2XBD5_ORYSI|nr:hypothetical protein OsI_09580 [Oryza sativa Indica Group]
MWFPYQANLPSAGANSAIQNFSGVRLLGLPFDCSDLDICKFFVGLDIVDCLLDHKNGCFTDEAFVVFPSAMQAEFALHRNRQNMGRRYVEVFRCKKQEYYSSIAAEKRTPPDVLKLRGLPYFTTAEDIIKFFVEYELTEENVHTAYRLDGKALYGVLNSRGCEDSHVQGQDDHWDKVRGAVPINPRGGQQDKITIHEPGNELFDPGIYFAPGLEQLCSILAFTLHA